MSGFSTLFRKEILRFWKVVYQTVAGPVISTVLYLLIFSCAEERVEAFPGVSLHQFPGPRPGDDERCCRTRSPTPRRR
jgi:ABC-2 type transport system permease protein